MVNKYRIKLISCLFVCVAVWPCTLSGWLRRVAIVALLVQWLSLSVCGSEDHEFEPRSGYGSYVFMISTKGLHYYTLKTVTRRTLRVCPPRYGCMTVNCEAKLVPLPLPLCLLIYQI